jgi:hypothetical protein
VRRILYAAAALVVLGTAALALFWPRQQFDMVKELARIDAQQDAWDNPWNQQERKIGSLQAELRSERDPIQRLILQRELAQQYVGGGTAEPGIALLEKLIEEYRGKLPPRDIETLKGDLALAWFRLGEQQNCTWSPNADACIFPIKGEGIHKERRGAAEAAKRFTELLENPLDSDNAMVFRWFLNLSHMVLGQWPAGVPKRFLIPPESFKSDYDVGLFRDVAATRGVSVFGRAGGAVLEDFDNDGYLDLMTSHMGIEEPVNYFRNNGDGSFTQLTEKARLKGITGGLNMVQADYDNDGCIDVFIPRGAWLHDKGQHPGSLLRNNCNGTFTDVTAKAGLLNYYPSQTAVWADFNGDGWLDLFIGHEIVREKVKWPADTPNFRLYLNNRNGTFSEIGAQSGIVLNGFVKGAAADDYDNDGRPDLYVSIMGGANKLFRNLGNAKFVDVTAKAGVAEPHMSFTCWWFDYNNDGWPDIFVSGYWATMPNIVREYLGDKANARGDRPRLYRNNRDGTFTDVSREARLDSLQLTMGANFGDLDNDGWLDFYLGTGAAPLTNVVPHQMFRNAGGSYFQNVTTSGGFGHLQKGHAVAFGDVDNDGAQDVFEMIGGVFPADKFWSALFRNPGQKNRWIKLRLTGEKANRFAVGARLRLQVTEDGKPREIWSTVSSGGSFGAHSLRPHLGLGSASAVDFLEIRWPGSGLVQRFDGPIAANRTYEIREGKPGLKEFRPSP